MTDGGTFEVTLEKARWGEIISIGKNIDGDNMEIRRPLNKVAEIELANSLVGFNVIVPLLDRIAELERKLGGMNSG